MDSTAFPRKKIPRDSLSQTVETVIRTSKFPENLSGWNVWNCHCRKRFENLRKLKRKKSNFRFIFFLRNEKKVIRKTPYRSTDKASSPCDFTRENLSLQIRTRVSSMMHIHKILRCTYCVCRSKSYLCTVVKRTIYDVMMLMYGTFIFPSRF